MQGPIAYASIPHAVLEDLYSRRLGGLALRCMLLVLAESIGKGRARAMGTKLGLCERLKASYSQTRAALVQLEAEGLLGIEKVGEGFVLTPLHPAIFQLLEERGARARGRSHRERRKTGTGRRRVDDVHLEDVKTACRKTGTGPASNARDTITAQEKKPPKPPAGGEGALLACGQFGPRPRLPESQRLDAKRRAELEKQAERLEVPKPWRLRELLAFVFATVPAAEAERIAGGAWEADRSPVALVSYRLRSYLERTQRPVGRWYHPTTQPETPPEDRATPEEMRRILRAALDAPPTAKAKEA